MTPLTDSITQNIAHADLSRRFVASTTIVASPTNANEVVIASLVLPANLTIVSGIILIATAGFTVGTSGVTGTLQIRHTNISGAVVGSSGAVTEVATHLDVLTAIGIDLAPVLPNQAYVATLTVGSAVAASTVNNAGLIAIAV